MAEKSLFFDTNGTGDGATTYTETDMFNWLRRTFSDGVQEGVDSELAVTGTSSPVQVAAGAAYVYGSPYWNDASLNVAISTPVVGTTGHRIVLRKNWTAQTVRVTLLSSSDGVSAIPAATQSAGTTWDITLATLTITTGGVITLTDARPFATINARVGTDNISANAVTNVKILDNTITAAKIVDGDNSGLDADLLKGMDIETIRRQGGNATNWGTAGTTNYSPTAFRIQTGKVNVTFSNTTFATSTVTFPVAFSGTPIVVATLQNNFGPEKLFFSHGTPTTTTVALTAVTEDIQITGTYAIDWIAIGPI